MKFLKSKQTNKQTERTDLMTCFSSVDVLWSRLSFGKSNHEVLSPDGYAQVVVSLPTRSDLDFQPF